MISLAILYFLDPQHDPPAIRSPIWPNHQENFDELSSFLE